MTLMFGGEVALGSPGVTYRSEGVSDRLYVSMYQDFQDPFSPGNTPYACEGSHTI